MNAIRLRHPKVDITAPETWFCEHHPDEMLFGSGCHHSTISICRRCMAEIFNRQRHQVIAARIPTISLT